MRFWELWPGRIYCFSLEKQRDVPTWTRREGFPRPVGTETCNSPGLTEKPQWTVLMPSLLRAFPGICCQISFAWCKPKAEGSDWLIWPTSDHTVSPLGSPGVLGFSVYSSLEDKQKAQPVLESAPFVHTASRPHPGFLKHRQPDWLGYPSDTQFPTHVGPRGRDGVNAKALSLCPRLIPRLAFWMSSLPATWIEHTKDKLWYVRFWKYFKWFKFKYWNFQRLGEELTTGGSLRSSSRDPVPFSGLLTHRETHPSHKWKNKVFFFLLKWEVWYQIFSLLKLGFQLAVLPTCLRSVPQDWFVEVKS